jgi:arginase family enzyme
VNEHQREQAMRFGVEMLEMKNWHGGEELRFFNPLYISFDMDVLDPAFAPGVSHHEPGGFSTREAVRLIQRIQAPSIAGGDVVEYNPRRDLNGVTAMAAAKILKEITAKILAGPENGSARR